MSKTMAAKNVQKILMKRMKYHKKPEIEKDKEM